MPHNGSVSGPPGDHTLLYNTHSDIIWALRTRIIHLDTDSFVPFVCVTGLKIKEEKENWCVTRQRKFGTTPFLNADTIYTQIWSVRG